MKWAGAISEQPDFPDALAEAVAAIRRALGGERPDLAVLFLSEQHRLAFDAVGEQIARLFPGAALLGCSARSVIGAGREVEERPGLSLTAAVLPDVEVHAFHLDIDDLAGLVRASRTGDDVAAWSRALGVEPRQQPRFVLLSDPFTFDAERLVRVLDEHFPRSAKVGGVASSGQQPGENVLFAGGRSYRSGAVGMALTGAIELDTIVAQGCRPIGVPMFVTRCRNNILLAIDDRPPIEVLQELYAGAEPRDRQLFRSSLFLGLEMKQAQSEYQQGDFLIRNLLGADEDSGALVIGASLHDTQVVQFHLRDALTSAEDLERRLIAYRDGILPASPPAGALLFSCLGRGKYLYGKADHDTDAFRRLVGPLPVGGFFCNGEIGPVEGTTFLHGYTSAFGVFREPQRTH